MELVGGLLDGQVEADGRHLLPARVGHEEAVDEFLLLVVEQRVAGSCGRRRLRGVRGGCRRGTRLMRLRDADIILVERVCGGDAM